MIPHFSIATKTYLNKIILLRMGEVKLGERITLAEGDDLEAIFSNSKSRFVLLGIPEDIGVRANGGVGGAHTVWEPALKAVVNIQSTELFSGEEILLLGAFDFNEWMQESESADIDQLRVLVSRIDDAVHPVIEAIVSAGKIPLVIGGGHNNAYPLLKGAASVHHSAIHCINLDAHSDYRIQEGRHSGNGFRYAKAAGYLERYAIVGLHRNYNSQAVLNDLEKDADINCSFYEDIFLKEPYSFEDAVNTAIAHTAGHPTGIELDLDCIERTLSSAATPCGITALQARKYLTLCAANAQPAYLHLTEGAVQLRDGRTDPSTAKLVAYLLSDFVRACTSHQ